LYLPGEWKGFNVTCFFRGARYNITVKNPEGVSKGVKSLTVNGRLIKGNLIPFNKKDKEVEVNVILGN